MNTALLTLLVVSVLMGTMAGGFGAVWLVHRTMRPSVGRAYGIATVMLVPVLAGLVWPNLLILVLLSVLGSACGVLAELYRIDRIRCQDIPVTPWADDVEVRVLTGEERERFIAEVDAYRSQH